jgi:hypothetical protein
MTELGPCCICEGTKKVKNIFMLPVESPYGDGWGCLQCGLPPAGAVAVVCDRCMSALRRDRVDVAERLKFFCKPGDDDYVSGRAPMAELVGSPRHDHDMSRHPGEF